MDQDRRFYVYVHRRKTDGSIFYVGKGSAYRMSDVKNRNRHWHNVARKHGFHPSKIFENLTEQCAYSIEKIIITCMPNLANYATGGQINSGYKWSDAARKRASVQRSGVKRKPLSKAHRDSLSAAKIGRPMSRSAIEKMIATKTGRKQIPEHAAKSRFASLKAIEKTSKSVTCLNDNMKFKSISEASRYYQMSVSSISQICNGKKQSVRGYVFCFDDEDLPMFAVEATVGMRRFAA